ncbi:MAG: hypothetical protein Q7R57_09930 [Dehalococcoidales bacterium]|nr:hypothetical protein [Dehalococcoidales bacterium]
MPSLPKLKVRSLLFGDEKNEVCDLDQVKGRFEPDTIVVVEGRLVNSYDELDGLVKNQYKDKEWLEVMLLPVIDGG